MKKKERKRKRKMKNEKKKKKRFHSKIQISLIKSQDKFLKICKTRTIDI